MCETKDKGMKHYTFTSNPSSILFVCAGNTCRSPMAEVIAKRWLEKNEKRCRVSSAGVEAVPGWFAAEHARTLCSPYLDDHDSKEVTDDLLSDFDLVFTMMPGHFDGLVFKFSHYAHKIYPLALDARPIHDPFGGDLAEYSRVYSILEEHVHKRMDELFFRRL